MVRLNLVCRDLNIDLGFPIKDEVSAWLMCLKAESLYEAGIIDTDEMNAVLERACAVLDPFRVADVPMRGGQKHPHRIEVDSTALSNRLERRRWWSQHRFGCLIARDDMTVRANKHCYAPAFLHIILDVGFLGPSRAGDSAKGYEPRRRNSNCHRKSLSHLTLSR
jgi:hypothetical protein